MGRKCIFKPMTRNDRFKCQYSDNDRIVGVNLATTRKSVKSTILLHENIYGYTKLDKVSKMLK